MADRPRTVIPRPYPEQPPGGWTSEKIREAIAHLERGLRIEPASRLTRAISRSAVYVLSRDQFIETAIGLPLEVLPAVRAWEGKALARTVAEEGRDVLRGLLGGGGAERWMIELGRMLNLAVGVLGWDFDDAGRWTPRTLERWPYDSIRLDPYARKLYAWTANAGEVEIVPGDGTWVVFSPGGLWNWDAALVRALGEVWFQESTGLRNLGNRAVADSVAGLDLPLPEGVEADSEEATAYMLAAQGLQTGKAGLLRPANYPEPRALDLSGKNASSAAKESLDRVEYRIKVGWIGQDGTTTNEGGSLAKAVVLNGVLYDKVESIVRDLHGALGADGAHEWGCITSQIMAPWVRFNWGREDLTPLVRRIVPDLEEGERLAGEAARSASFTSEISALKSAGYALTPRDVEELAKLRGVRLPTGMVWSPPVSPPSPPPPLKDERPVTP